MKADYQEITEKISIALEGNITQSIENFTKQGK